MGLFRTLPLQDLRCDRFDGKTTTTTLISEFLAHAGFRVHKGRQHRTGAAAHH
ncbi:MAG: hypothetical protein ACLUOF_04835 [Ruminococcus sp.]